MIMIDFSVNAAFGDQITRDGPFTWWVIQIKISLQKHTVHLLKFKSQVETNQSSGNEILNKRIF